MENIAAVRPHMAVLDQNKLTLSPFGALSHALAEEILARTGQAEGVYPYVPLELLTEPEGAPKEKKEEPAVNVEVKLTLELTKEARELRERTETVERILERIERIRERGETVQKPQGRERDSAPSLESRNFFQNINQHISFPMTLSVPDAAETSQPGGIARISERFANTLKTMREEGLYTEPGGRTQRVADVGRGGRTAEKEAAESGTALSGERERAIAGRTAASGSTDRSAADFVVTDAQTQLNTADGSAGSPERSPEITARAAERIGQTIAERAAREIKEQFQEIVKQEAQAEGRTEPERDGRAGTASQNIDHDRGQTARETIETGRPSETRRREARDRSEAYDREDRQAAESAEGEGPRAALSGTRERTERAGEDEAGRGEASPDSLREAIEPEDAGRPARAVPVRSEDRPLSPEDLTLAPDGTSERAGEEPFKAGREAGEAPRRAHAHGREARARREDENKKESEAAPRRVENTRTGRSADEDTAEAAEETGTRDRAEGPGLTGETKKPGSTQRAGEETTASRPADRDGKTPEGPDRAVRGREPERMSGREAELALGREEPETETPEARSDRVRSGAAPEGEAREADGGPRPEAEAIPLRGESALPAPEELTLTSAAERGGDRSPTAGRQAMESAERAAGRAGSAPDRENGTPGTGTAVDTVRTETVRVNGETGPVREAGQSEAATRAGDAASGGEASPDKQAGQGERAAEAIPVQGALSTPAPEELAHRTEEPEAPESGAGTRAGGEVRRAGEDHTAGEARHVSEDRRVAETRRVGETRDVEEPHDVGKIGRADGVRDTGENRKAGEARSVREAREVIEARETEEARKAGLTRHAGEVREAEKARGAEEAHRAGERLEAGAAEAIPVRGEFGVITPEELALAPSEGAAQPEGDRQAGTARTPAANETRGAQPLKGERDHIDGRKAPDAVREETGETASGTGKASGKPTEAGRTQERSGRTGEPRADEREAAKLVTPEVGEAGQGERAAEAIPVQGALSAPAPEELTHRTEEPEAPESGAGTRAGGEVRRAGKDHRAAEAHHVGEDRRVAETRRVGETHDVEEPHDVGKIDRADGVRDTGETRKAGEARSVREAREVIEIRESEEARKAGLTRHTGEVHEAEKARGAEEAHRAGERLETGAAEAIPVRGEFGVITPEELALAPSEGAAQPEGDRQAGTVRTPAANETRGARPRSGERDHIDGRMAPDAVREESGETASGTGRTSGKPTEAGRTQERSGRTARASEEAGRAGKVSEEHRETGKTSDESDRTARATEEAGKSGRNGEPGADERKAAKLVTPEAGEAGQGERAAEAIPVQGALSAPAPEELTHRTEEPEAPESGAALGPGNTAKSVEAFAERIAERVRRAETSGFRTDGRGIGPMSGALRGPEAASPRHARAVGAGNAGFPPPVELTGAAERAGGPESAGIPAQPARESAGSPKAVRSSQAAYIPESLEYGGATPPKTPDSAEGTGAVTGREARRARRPVEKADRSAAAAGPAPVELTYGGTGEARAEEQPKTQPPVAESDYVKSLPDWARRFLKEGAGSLGTAGSMAVTSIPDAVKAQKQKPQMVEWTAPGFHQQPPAETQFKELKPPEDAVGQTGEVHISDAEIRRTADKVYKIIEDRIRRERRRLGL